MLLRVIGVGFENFLFIATVGVIKLSENSLLLLLLGWLEWHHFVFGFTQ